MNPFFENRIPIFEKHNAWGYSLRGIWELAGTLGAQGWPSGGLREKCCFSIVEINIFEKHVTISPARDECDIDFDCIFTRF